MNANVLVLVSIVIGVAISDQLTSLHRLLKRRAEVRWDPLLLWTAAAVLLTLVRIWWSVAGQRTAPITIGEFLPLLAELILLFLLAAASLPDELGDGVIVLRTYYDAQRRYLWSLFALALALLIGTQLATEALAGERIGWLALLPDIGIVAIMGSLAAVRWRPWHYAVLAALTFTGPIAWLGRALG